MMMKMMMMVLVYFKSTYQWQQKVDRQGEQVQRMAKQMMEHLREARKLAARTKELERECKHRGWEGV